jgi:hypothetical protein
MSTWTRRSPVCPVTCTSHGDSGPPGQRNAWGWRSTRGGAWDKRAHTAAASGSVPPGGSQRSVSTAVPATLLLARITSAVAAGAVAGRFEPSPQPVTVRAAAIPAMIATVRLASMSYQTAAPRRKVPALRRPASRRIADRPRSRVRLSTGPRLHRRSPRIALLLYQQTTPSVVRKGSGARSGRVRGVGRLNRASANEDGWGPVPSPTGRDSPWRLLGQASSR